MWLGFDPMCTWMKISNIWRCWVYQYYQQLDSHSPLQRHVIWGKFKKKKSNSVCDAQICLQGCGGRGRDLFIDAQWNVPGYNSWKLTHTMRKVESNFRITETPCLCLLAYFCTVFAYRSGLRNWTQKSGNSWTLGTKQEVIHKRWQCCSSDSLATPTPTPACP